MLPLVRGAHDQTSSPQPDLSTFQPKLLRVPSVRELQNTHRQTEQNQHSHSLCRDSDSQRKTGADKSPHPYLPMQYGDLLMGLDPSILQ